MKKSLLLVLLLILGISFGSSLFAQVTITIGDGTETNTTTGAPAPYGTWYKAFRQQYLIRASEFNNAGAGPGNITSLSFNVVELNNITPMNNFRIRLKHTTQTALTSAFEAGDYQVVFQAASFTPTVGWNDHTFSAPFNWDGSSNVLVDIVTDVIDGSYAQNASVAYTQTSFNSSLRFQSDTANGDTGTTGTAVGNRSNMKFVMQQLDMDDMAAIVITGPNAPNINSTVNYTITVKSLCADPVSNYTVKLMKAPNTMIASVPGTTINFLQELQFTMPWTPNEEGGFQLFGRVEMAGDENPNNDNSPMLDVTVIPAGLVNVTIGDGTTANTTTGPPTPYGSYWQNFREQYLITAAEINNAGGGPGDIYGISFNVDNVNNCSAMPNYRIRIKPTNQTALSTSFEPGDYQQVFQAPSFMPTTGWNFHPFSTPYVWDGASNLLIDVVCDLVGGYTQNASVFYTNVGFNSSLRFQSDSSPADQATTGTASTNRSNMILNMEQLDMQDMVGMSIVGSTTPSVNSVVNYTIKVKNLSPNNVTNYTVKLMEGPSTMIASTAGTVIGPMEELEFILPWTPTTMGATQLYGRVEMPGDENPANDNTPMLDVTVMEAGLLVVQVGDGTAVNANTGSPAPYGTWYKAFREQYLFRADEIYAAGGAPGLINALAFNVQSLDECTPMTNFLIRVKHTEQTALGTSFEAGDYETVFQADTFMPTNDWNLHPFSTPFFWNGADNLLIDVSTDVCTGDYARNALVYYSTPGFNSSLRFQSDSANGSTGTSGTASANRSNARFFMIVEDMGSMSGTVTSAGAPVADATVWVEDTVFTTTTAADGTYSLPFVPVGANTVSATKHGYNVVSHNVNIVDGQNTTQNFAISLLPQVTVTGRIVGSDQPTVGLADATIRLSGYEPYETTTNAQGQFTIPNVFASQTYQYVANALGYQPAMGQAVVGTTNLNMGDIIVNEMAFPPYGVVANENDSFTQVNVTWEAPNPSAVDITEGFEGDTFPPEDWSQIITNPNEAALGVMATWCRFGTIALDPVVPPHSGDWQAGLWWEYGHQDEWLITPEFTCPPNTELKFWSYVFLGSTYGDHYYVKASTDGGNTWTVLWDAAEQTGEWNYYDTPITVPLDAVAGQQVKLAWQAIDGDGQGLWHVWFIDDVTIGMPDGVLRFPMNQFTTRSASENSSGFTFNSTGINRPISRAWVDNPELEMSSRNIASTQNNERVMNGYRVYRLLAADQANENNWTELTPSNITPTNYTDTAWGPLPSGVYKYAVKAVYTNNVMSIPAFSNELHKGMMGVLTGTVTEFGTDLPIEGATITAGEYSGVSNAQGEYSFSVYAGTYNVTCSKVGYQASTQNGVVIVGLQTTTQNFVLTEITLPPGAVQAEEAGNNVNITWMEPGTAGGEWIYYCGEKDDSIGTGGVAEFDVAIRFPASALTDYAGMSLQAVKVWPAQGGTFKARVWTGGNAAAPAVQEVDQLFTPTLDTYNTVILDDPVTITGTEELWFGYNCNVTSGYPAGCDAGPADEGLGNMMYFQGAWATLNDLADLNYNWCIQGYVGYSAPTDAPRISPISLRSAYPGQYDDMDRALTGYKVWRLQQGQEGSENSWTSLTPNPISATAYQDTQWNTLADGTYKWAVKAIYTGGAASPAAFSNAVPRITQI
ncbi:MAG: carboxypeptidase regulatory-like domain-containing protein, partial [Methanofastidiosum sp.]